jgi:tRNA modification GTPase
MPASCRVTDFKSRVAPPSELREGSFPHVTAATLDSELGAGGCPTRAALLTALAPGGIAVIALEGPQVESILQDVLRRPIRRAQVKRITDAPAADAGVDGESGPQFIERRPTLCRVVDGPETIDDVIAVLIRRGEQGIAELCTHGGVRVAQRVLMLLASRGALIVAPNRLSQVWPGEGPVAGDVDHALLRSPSRRLTTWLLHQRAALPAFLGRFKEVAGSEQAAYRRRTAAAIRLIRGISVAIIGPPNAGKSTLANRLIGHDRMITSDQPGTTRDWVAETALINGWPVTLTDTAGIRETECVIETEAIRRGRERAIQCDLALIVVDATAPCDQHKDSYGQSAGLMADDAPRVLVLNKCDREVPARAFVPDAPRCMVSALQGTGIAELEKLLEGALGLDQLRDELPTGFLPRHLEAGEQP